MKRYKSLFKESKWEDRTVSAVGTIVSKLPYRLNKRDIQKLKDILNLFFSGKIDINESTRQIKKLLGITRFDDIYRLKDLLYDL